MKVMKKLIYVLFAVMGAIVFSSATFANKNETQLTMPHPVPVGSSAVCDAWPTCINIYNNSYYPIQIEVPSLFFFGTLYPYYMQALQSSDSYYKRVILYNWLGQIFFDSPVSPHAVIDVRDYNGKLSAQVK
jgi:hypothetical protein